MMGLSALIKRNTKMFFKDKGLFFTSLITPMILLVLYATFLSNVYKDSFMLSIPPQLQISDRVIDAVVGGQLMSSLLAVSCVTVSFCSNMLMVQDKVTGASRDLRITPVKGSTMALGYYISTAISTLIICLLAAGACFIYLANIGWYLSVGDLLLILLDVFLLTMFGVALSSVINFFLSTQGQISAVGSIISSCYGFICGAYMPISNFAEGLQDVIMFLPGTYGTSLLRQHSLRGALEALGDEGVPTEAVKEMADAVDCNLYFFDGQVGEGTKYLVLVATIALLIGAYILMNVIAAKRARRAN